MMKIPQKIEDPVLPFEIASTVTLTRKSQLLDCGPANRCTCTFVVFNLFVWCAFFVFSGAAQPRVPQPTAVFVCFQWSSHHPHTCTHPPAAIIRSRRDRDDGLHQSVLER